MDWLEERVRQAQQEQEDLIKSQLGDFEKAKSGIYADTPYNRKKGLVGQKYGSEKQGEEKPKEEGKKEPEKKEDNKKEDSSDPTTWSDERLKNEKARLLKLRDEGQMKNMSNVFKDLAAKVYIEYEKRGFKKN